MNGEARLRGARWPSWRASDPVPTAVWEERSWGPARPAAQGAAAPASGAHGGQPPAAQVAPDGEATCAGATARAGCDGGALRRLLDGVEAEHARQLRALREELDSATEQLAQARHGACSADDVAPARIALRAPSAIEAARAGEGSGGGGGTRAPESDPAQTGVEEPETEGCSLPGTAYAPPPPQGRQSPEGPDDSGIANLHEPPASNEGDKPGEARPSDTSAAVNRSSRKIVWQVRGRTQDNMVRSMITRLLVSLGVSRTVSGKCDGTQMHVKDEMSAVGIFMNSTPVNVMCCMAIVINTMCIGASAHFTLRAEINQESVSSTWEHLEVGFTAWFTVELLLRLVGERRLFYCGVDRWWNLLDLFLVVSSLTMLLVATAVPSLTTVRMLRIFRLARIIRNVRVVRSIQNFRIIFLAIIRSFGTLMWAVVVVLSFQFIFAVLFMHGAAEYFKEGALHSDNALAVKDLFGDIFTALLTLFEAITGGRDWHEVMVALQGMHWTYGSTFLVYMFFMTFLVLNVVVGGVVATTSEVYKRDRDFIVHEEQKRARQHSDEIKSFFRDADNDGSRTLSWEEFKHHLNDDNVKAYFQSLDLDISKAHLLFDVEDTDKDDVLGFEEFINGCISMKGHARTIDVWSLAKQIQNGLEEMTRMFNDKFDQLAGLDAHVR